MPRRMSTSEWGPVTMTLLVLTTIAALTGAAVVILGDQRGPDALSFKAYLDIMRDLVIGLGLLGIGRGVLRASRRD